MHAPLMPDARMYSAWIAPALPPGRAPNLRMTQSMIYTPLGSAVADLQFFYKPPPYGRRVLYAYQANRRSHKTVNYLPDSLRSSRNFMLFHFAGARQMRGGPDIIFRTRIRFASMKRYSFQQDSTNSP